MRGSKSKRLDALARDSSHGAQLRVILGVLRADRDAKRKLYARERNEARKASIAREIDSISGLITLREGELQAAIDAAAAEKALA